MNVWVDAGFLVGGLVALLSGGDTLVRGATEIARRMGVAPIIIGMTVVAFGTSTPELVVNVAASLRGSSEIGFGNVVGSNIANIGFLLGLSALLLPLQVHRTIAVREIPMMILAGAAAVVLGLGGTIDGGALGYGRGDGLMLLLLFVVFLYYTLGDALQQRRDAFLEGAVETVDRRFGSIGGGLMKPILLVVAGLALLIVGGQLTVRGAVGIATALGLSEAVIGLTIVAIGTGMPELATSLIAVRRGQADVAVGNIVGSNIFNLLFVWGMSVTVLPSALPAGGAIDLAVMVAFSVVLLPMVVTQQRLSRVEGGLILVAYVGYIGWLVVR